MVHDEALTGTLTPPMSTLLKSFVTCWGKKYRRKTQ